MLWKTYCRWEWPEHKYFEDVIVFKEDRILWITVISLLMNFWSDILNRSCKGGKNVLYILYYNTLQFILFKTVHDKSMYIYNYSSGLHFCLIWIFQCMDLSSVGMKPSLLELRFPSSFLCYINCLFLHMFLGQGGNKRPGPTSSVPPKKRKCGICKQEGKAVAVFHVMFLGHISQTDVLKPSYNFWLQSKIFNICTFCALWLTCGFYDTSPLRLFVAWSLLTGMANTGTIVCVCTRHLSGSLFLYCYCLILSNQEWWYVFVCPTYSLCDSTCPYAVS